MDIKSKSKMIEFFRGLAGESNVITSRDSMVDYTGDEFYRGEAGSFPACVVKPGTVLQVAGILKYAGENRIPVVTRGGGTGMCGGCSAVDGEVVLSTERLNRIMEIDRQNRMAVVQAGVTLGDFYKAVEKEGLFFAPHPGDESATLGGAAATNAGGARAVKYGVFRNFIKSVEAVLPDGSIINTGGKVLKNSTGYNLTQLLIGSEGTLAVITGLVIGLMSKAEVAYTLIVSYRELAGALRSVNAILDAGITPLAVEFLEHDCVLAGEAHLDRKWPCAPAGAYLIMIVDGRNADEVDSACVKLEEVCMKDGAVEVLVAENRQKQEDILYLRSHLYEVLKPGMLSVLDACVPRSAIVDFVDRVHKLSEEYGIWLPTFGHAADGNIHTHVMKYGLKGNKMDLQQETKGWAEKLPLIEDELYGYARELGGVLSGEHGIGVVKRAHFYRISDKKNVELMKLIKKAFDPDNILNPGKIF